MISVKVQQYVYMYVYKMIAVKVQQSTLLYKYEVQFCQYSCLHCKHFGGIAHWYPCIN